MALTFVSPALRLSARPRIPTLLCPRHSVTKMTLSGTRRVLVPIGRGSEEIEAATVVDVLRRAGAEVVVASVEDALVVEMSRGMKFCADVLCKDDQGAYDAVCLPGGMPGAERLAASDALADILKAVLASGGVVGAICAAPSVVLAQKGMLDGVGATCYPAEAFRKAMPLLADGDVVETGQFVTATGPGTAMKWSLAMVEKLYSIDLAQKLAEEMLVVG